MHGTSSGAGTNHCMFDTPLMGQQGQNLYMMTVVAQWMAECNCGIRKCLMLASTKAIHTTCISLLCNVQLQRIHNSTQQLAMLSHNFSHPTLQELHNIAQLWVIADDKATKLSLKATLMYIHSRPYWHANTHNTFLISLIAVNRRTVQVWLSEAHIKQFADLVNSNYTYEPEFCMPWLMMTACLVLVLECCHPCTTQSWLAAHPLDQAIVLGVSRHQVSLAHLMCPIRNGLLSCQLTSSLR